MIRYLLVCFLLVGFSVTNAQPTHVYTDSERKFKQAKEFVEKGDYGFAYPLIKELKNEQVANPALYAYIQDDLNYYAIICGLQLLHETAGEEAKRFIGRAGNSARKDILSFHLAHSYFVAGKYEDAIYYYNAAGLQHLTNDQVAQLKFEKAYSHFSMNSYTEAKPLFNEIHQIPSNKFYIPANYYYGLIAYRDKEYDEALKSFMLVENTAEYKGVVPYYVSEIYYQIGKKDEALAYGEKTLQQGLSPHYEKQLKLLIGQLHFEKKDFKRALPFLRNYVAGSAKVSKEILYELSYAYYKEGDFENAMEGFRQLSNERDSLGQNSMYLLGDLYLKKGDKENARNAFQYCSYNNSNPTQQRVSKFNYAKLSYELGYQDIALKEMNEYLSTYPASEFDSEAKGVLVGLLANSNDFDGALKLYQSITSPSSEVQKIYPRILFGKAVHMVNDNKLTDAETQLAQVASVGNVGALLPHVQFWRGEVAYRQLRYSDAIQHLSNYLSFNPTPLGEASPVAARYNLGYSYLQSENYRQAINNFETIAKVLTPNASSLEQDAYLRSADAYFMLRDYNKANNMYADILNGGFAQADYALYQQAMIAGVKNSAEKIKLLAGLQKKFPATTLAGDIDMEIADSYIEEEQFAQALPYLNKIIQSSNEGLKPKALLKTGLANYNDKKNSAALTAYKQLFKKYPQSQEADDAVAVVKDIYLEEGRTAEFLELMAQSGRGVSGAEADSLTYAAAYMKFNAGNCSETIAAMNNYLSRYADGNYVMEANFYKAQCQQQNKDWSNALLSYDLVMDKGLSRFYEQSALQAARICYFDLKNYAAAKQYFELLYNKAVGEGNRLEAMRGLVRSLYQVKDYNNAMAVSKELLSTKNISLDDKAVANLVLGKSLQLSGNCNDAVQAFKAVASVNKSLWGAEARYEMASCYLKQKNYTAAEKAGMAVIKETGGYDLWVTKAYVLLGDLFLEQKDYFNAKATYESVARNAAIPEIRAEAQSKYDKAVAEEKINSKVQN